MRNFTSLLQSQGLAGSLIRVTIGSAGLRIAGLGFAFLLALLLARSLGPAAYGVYGTAMAVMAILTAAAEMGMARLVTREFVAAELDEDWGRMRGVLRWSRRTALLISLALMLGTGLWAWFIRNSDPVLAATLLVGALWVPLVSISNINAAGLAGLRCLIRGQIPEILLRPAFFSLSLFIASLLALDLSPVSAIALGVASAVIGYVASALLLRQNLPTPVFEHRPKSHSREWFKSALPIALSDGVRVSQAQVIVLILAALASDTVTGTYRAAASIFVLFVLPEAMFNLVCAPAMARLHGQRDWKRLQRVLTWAAVGNTVATAALVLPFILFGETLVVLLLGAEFGPSSTPLIILGIGGILTAAMGPVLVLMNIASRDREVVSAGAIALALLLLVGVPLIQLEGANGAALAFSLSFFLWRALVWFRAKRDMKLDSSLLSLPRILRR